MADPRRKRRDEQQLEDAITGATGSDLPAGMEGLSIDELADEILAQAALAGPEPLAKRIDAPTKLKRKPAELTTLPQSTGFDTLDTLDDALEMYGRGILAGGADELVGAVLPGSSGAREAMRTRADQAHARSPVVSIGSEIAGGMTGGALMAPAAAAAGVPAALSIFGGGMLGGALESDSDDPIERIYDAYKGGFISTGVGKAVGAGARGVNRAYGKYLEEPVEAAGERMKQVYRNTVASLGMTGDELNKLREEIGENGIEGLGKWIREKFWHQSPGGDDRSPERKVLDFFSPSGPNEYKEYAQKYVDELDPKRVELEKQIAAKDPRVKTEPIARGLEARAQKARDEAVLETAQREASRFDDAARQVRQKGFEEQLVIPKPGPRVYTAATELERAGAEAGSLKGERVVSASPEYAAKRGTRYVIEAPRPSGARETDYAAADDALRDGLRTYRATAGALADDDVGARADDIAYRAAPDWLRERIDGPASRDWLGSHYEGPQPPPARDSLGQPLGAPHDEITREWPEPRPDLGEETTTPWPPRLGIHAADLTGADDLAGRVFDRLGISDPDLQGEYAQRIRDVVRTDMFGHQAEDAILVPGLDTPPGQTRIWFRGNDPRKPTPADNMVEDVAPEDDVFKAWHEAEVVPPQKTPPPIPTEARQLSELEYRPMLGGSPAAEAGEMAATPGRAGAPIPQTVYTGEQGLPSAIATRKKADEPVKWARHAPGTVDPVEEKVGRAVGALYRGETMDAIERAAPEYAQQYQHTQSELHNALQVLQPAANAYWRGLPEGAQVDPLTLGMGATVAFGDPTPLAVAAAARRGQVRLKPGVLANMGAAAAGVRANLSERHAAMLADPNAQQRALNPDRVAGRFATSTQGAWAQARHSGERERSQERERIADDGRGHLLVKKAQEILAQQPEAFGPYLQELQPVAADPARLGVRLRNLMKNPAFNARIGDALMKATAGP